ncbi:MAG: AgmX/PglI C-terminal domain-containing protein [Halobacteriovoraceae bacterium]|nr:AgmX/PglI C-terminal domain-containing protein [Halobacteriovoraceae bacterium]
MLRARTVEEKIHYLVGYKDGAVAYEFALNKKKLLLGRAEHADICIEDKALSHYHAFITIDDHGGKIIDLESDNGIYLNGVRQSQTFFGAGDTLRIGPIEFHIEERIIEVEGQEGFEDQDKGIVEVLEENKITELPPELPPMPGLVVIDGEYCDIVFDDDTFQQVDHVPATEGQLSFDEYIDAHEVDEKELSPIARKVEEMAIEVTVLVNGNVLSIDYLPLKNKTFYVSNLGRHKNTLCLPCLDEEDRLPFIDIDGTNITMHKIPGFTAKNRETGEEDLFSNKETGHLLKKDVFCYGNKSVQIVVKLTDAPPSLKAAPFFGRDRAFQKEAGKIFGILMSLMLLILFIDTSVDPPKKKIAVIYRKAIKAKKPSDKRSKSIADKVDKDTGIKQNKQPNKETKMAKKSPEKATKKKQKTMKQPKKMAKAASSPKKVKKAPKMKAYKFKASNKLSSLLGSTKNLKPTKINKNSNATGTSGFKSVSNVSDSALKAKSNSAVGTLGQDFSGNYDSSAGAQGLSSKSGIDTTYQDPKTVVLGSMDPELLRKILKEYLPQFRHCYQKELERNEAAKGVIDLHFRINPNGTVSQIKIKGKKAKFSRSGSGCMAGVLKLIDFPKPKGGGVVDVKQPLNFFSEQDKY